MVMSGPPEGPAAVWDSLDAGLEAALGPLRRSELPRTVLFSGGVDSSLLAWELRTHRALHLLTVGTRGSPDLEAGASAASVLGLPVRSAEITPDVVARLVGALERPLAGLDPVGREVLIALAVGIDASSTRLVVAGQGVDELFLGYAHFRGLGPERAAERAREDLDRLLLRDWPRTVEIAELLGHEIVAPYLAPPFRDVAEGIPIERRIPAPEPKSLFRAWARHRGLPERIAMRPKRALQYGSGIGRLVRRRRA